ncbi:MAG: penicillin-binding protein activator [Pseudobdellovibrionaceae bacterium]
MIRWLFLIFATLFILSCSTSPRLSKQVPAQREKKDAPEKASATAQSEYSSAKKDMAAKKNGQALKKFHNIIRNHPQSDLYDDAAFLSGQIFYSANEYQKALETYALVFNSTKESPLSGDSYYWASKASAQLNKVDLAKKYADLALAEPSLTTSKRTELSNARIAALEAGPPLELLSEYLTLSAATTDSATLESYRLKTQDIIETRLNEQELQTVAGTSDYGPLRSHAYYRLGEMALMKRDIVEARSYFSKVSDLLPGTDLADRAAHYLVQLEAARRVDAKTIGVVLPMSGKHAAISQKVLRGIEMGLGLHSQIPSQFKIAVIDSEANPEGARRAVERLVTEDNVIAIIGSVLSKTATAVALKASELGVPNIALSQKTGITDLGPSVLRNSLTSEMQVRYLVRMAMEDLGYNRFAVIYPNDAYGVELTNLFWDEVLARGGQITAAQTYNPKESDFTEVVQRLTGTFYAEDRREEIVQRSKKLKQDNVKKSVRQDKNPAEFLPGIADFDAIFIPDTVRALGLIAPTLAYNGVTKARFLGTNLWNNPQLVKRIGKFSDNVLFVDSYSPLDPRASSSLFVKEYKSLFGEEPGNFEFQGYDSALMIRQAILQGADSRDALLDKLTSLKEFPGSLGPLYLAPDREVQRPIVALGVNDGEIRPLTTQEIKR